MTGNVGSDFAPPPAVSAWGPGAGVGGIVFATFALGFTEGCLEIERRPIPLRFALRFAAVNVLPSAVWSSIPARDVAAVSRVSLSALVKDSGEVTASLGNRLVLISLKNEPRGHVVTVATTDKWKEVVSTVEWKKVGVEVETEEGNVERVKVLEVELSEDTTECANKLSNKARDTSGQVFSVAVLPMRGPPLPTTMTESFDVCFNPLSAVLTFIAEICHSRSIAHAVLVDGMLGNDGLDSHLSTTEIAAGLLYRHGITSTILNAPLPKQLEDDVAGRVMDSACVVFFVSENLIAGQTVASEFVKQGLAIEDNACFVVQESLNGLNVPSTAIQARSALLEAPASMGTEDTDTKDASEQEQIEQEVPMATFLSVADVSDQTLQGIREMIRRGTALGLIQGAVYQAYGTQRVVTPPRVDQFSSLNV